MSRWILLLLVLSVGTSPGASSYPKPTTPDALVENLERSLEEMDLDEYEHLLDWTYVFDFAPEHEWLAPGGWTLAQELDAMRRLLGGEPTRFGTTPRRAIGLDVSLEPMGPWEETQEDLYGVLRTWRRDFAAKIEVHFDDDTSSFVHRRQVLTVVAGYDEARLELGEFKLLRWEEEEWLGPRPFGALKARF